MRRDPESDNQIDDRYVGVGFDAMGCRFEILIDPDRSAIPRVDCRAIAEESRSIVLDWHRRLSVFEPGSMVSRINTICAGSPVALDADLYSLCLLCDDLRIRTRGAFNICAGTLMHQYGFRDRAQEHHPDTIDLSSALDLDRENRTITRQHVGVQIDFGAIAKGYALDLVRDELVEMGVAHAFVQGGSSSVIAIGAGADENPWKARVGDGIHSTTIALSGYALGVSESHSRLSNRGDVRSGHVMDPRAGVPADSSIVQFACVHASAALADAYSTACIVDPALCTELAESACTMVGFDVSSRVVLEDPLGVVYSEEKEKQ